MESSSCGTGGLTLLSAGCLEKPARTSVRVNPARARSLLAAEAQTGNREASPGLDGSINESQGLWGERERMAEVTKRASCFNCDPQCSLRSPLGDKFYKHTQFCMK